MNGICDCWAVQGMPLIQNQYYTNIVLRAMLGNWSTAFAPVAILLLLRW